jgi:hypothetical protein
VKPRPAPKANYNTYPLKGKGKYAYDLGILVFDKKEKGYTAKEK